MNRRQFIKAAGVASMGATFAGLVATRVRAGVTEQTSDNLPVPPGFYTLFDEEMKRPTGPWNKPPLQKPAYPTENFIILDYGDPFGQHPGTNTGMLGTGLPYSYYRLLADNGVRGIKLNLRLSANPALTRPEDEEVIRRGLNVFYIDVPDEGYWIDLQRRRKRDPNMKFWDFKVPARLEELEQWKTVNYLVDTFADCQVMLLVGGELEDTQYLTYGLHGSYKDDFDKIRQAYINYHRAWVKQLKTNLTQPDKVLTFEQSLGAAYPMAYLLKSYDLSQSKTWGRQNVEVDIANNRGASRSYDRPFMLADDPWVGSQWFTRSPEEMEQVFYLAYLSGADYLYHEYIHLIQTGETFQPNRWGQKYLDFARFTALHPQRGRQHVRLAVMRGFGDAWDEIFTRYMFGDWGKVRPIHDKTIRDYDLLKVFFAEFGNRYETDPFRLCTGTPFGPVDLVPWDTPPEKLRAYQVIFFFGINAMDDQQYRALKQYVEQGGTLVLSLGQLRVEGKDPRPILPAAQNDEFLGVRLDPLPKIVSGETPFTLEQLASTVKDYCELTVDRGKALARTASDAPVIVRNDYGKGRVCLYATEFLHQVKDEFNLRFFAELARPARLLTLEPPSDWLEYTVWQKGRSLLLNLFNHGRVKFPSGNGPDHGLWEGMLTVDFAKFPELGSGELEAFLVTFADPLFQFTPIPLTMHSHGVSLRMTVDLRAEVLVGPSRSAQKQFFHAAS